MEQLKPWVIDLSKYKSDEEVLREIDENEERRMRQRNHDAYMQRDRYD